MINKQIMYNYLNSCAAMRPFYAWGYDMEPITEKNLKEHIKMYGKEKYEGFDNKIGYYGCDCSGILTPITGKNQTAAAWYTSCIVKGLYRDCDESFCLVFKVQKGEIVHVGVKIDTKTYEMYNRLDIKEAKGGTWNYYGIPDIFDVETKEMGKNYIIDGKFVRLLKRYDGYYTSDEAINNVNPRSDLIAGCYHIYKVVDIKGKKCYNLSVAKNCPGAWVCL